MTEGVSLYGEGISTIAGVDDLDECDMLEGYRDGRAGDPEPKGNRSKAYWHGWRNGAVDGGHRVKDAAQAALAAETVAAMRRARSAASHNKDGGRRQQHGADHG